MILLIFALIKILEKHMEEYGIYAITNIIVIRFISMYVVVTGDYGALLELCYLVYTILRDDTFIGY